jgi:fengycin family lipopeptide synthetase B
LGLSLIEIFSLENIDVSLLEKSIQNVSYRHLILTAKFFVNDEEDYKWSAMGETPVKVYNYSDLSEESFNKIIIQHFNLAKKSKMFLEKDALMQYDLFVKSEKSFFIIWKHHHIITDGWSLGIILKQIQDEYFRLYHSLYNKNKEFSQFNHCVKVLREEYDDIKSQSFWEKYLENVKFQNKSKKKRLVKLINFDVEKKSYFVKNSFKILSFCRKHRLTPNSVFLAIWMIIVNLYKLNPFLLTGVTFAIRHLPVEDVTEIVGPLINTVPFACKLNKKIQIIQYLRSIQENILSVYDQSQTPLHKIYNWIRKKYNINIPLINHNFVFENYPSAFDENSNLINFKFIDSFETTEFNLNVIIYEKKNDFYIEFKYNKNFYCSKFIEKIGNSYLKMIDQCIENPSLLMGSIFYS